MTEVMQVPEGKWMPLYHHIIWHYVVLEDGHLKTLCGIWIGPGGTSIERRKRTKCPRCVEKLQEVDTIDS